MQAAFSKAISLVFRFLMAYMYWKTDFDRYQDSIEQCFFSPVFHSFAEFQKGFYELYPDVGVLCHIML